MTYAQIVRYYGTASNVARALGISRQAISKWGKRGHVPYEAQLLIEKATDGKLVATGESKYNPIDLLRSR